ncbi:MAG: hypothetical protein Q4D42_12670 [Eubacteriales bacterium]|nr:hypothetical protein [Eubacteriales bacterium]
MRKSVPVRIKVYDPETDEQECVLAEQVAEVHADFIYATIQKQEWTAEQKRSLVEAIVQKVTERQT